MPDAVNFTDSNTTDIKEVVLSDVDGQVNLYDYAGGTILKVLLDQFVLPVVGGATNADGNFVLHSGIFTVQDSAPSAVLWTPNTPFGDFMLRWTQYATFHTNGDPTSGGSMTALSGVRSVDHFAETSVRRRIRENTRLFVSRTYFENSPVESASVGYTGRVLIQLP